MLRSPFYCTSRHATWVYCVVSWTGYEYRRSWFVIKGPVFVMYLVLFISVYRPELHQNILEQSKTVTNNDGWMIYQDNLQTIVCALGEWAVHKNAKSRQTDCWWTSVWTGNFVCCSLVSLPSDKQTIIMLILYCLDGVNGQAVERHGRPFGWADDWWVYVARAQGVALLLNECRVWAMKTWAKGVYIGQEFAVNNIVRFMAVNRDLWSMTIRVPDCDPRYAIRKL